MFERYTERARQVVVLAQDEARLLKHNYIGAEHLLLGLLREQEGVASRVLVSWGFTTESVREAIRAKIGEGDEALPDNQQIPFTPRAKTILELSLREALSMGHNYIGTEHVLLGLVRQDQGVATEILSDKIKGDAQEKIRNEIIRKLSGDRAAQPKGTKEKRAEEVLAQIIDQLTSVDAARLKNALRVGTSAFLSELVKPPPF